MEKVAVQKKRIEFDAKGENLGRLAVRIADALRGKDTPAFRPNKMPDRTVVVFNTNKLAVRLEKGGEKTYYAHSGCPGGLAEETLESLMKRDSREVIKRAVYGMLPKNKLREKFIANLKLFKEELK